MGQGTGQENHHPLLFQQWPELKLRWWTQTLPQVEKKHNVEGAHIPYYSPYRVFSCSLLWEHWTISSCVMFLRGASISDDPSNLWIHRPYCRCHTCIKTATSQNHVPEWWYESRSFKLLPFWNLKTFIQKIWDAIVNYKLYAPEGRHTFWNTCYE